MSKFYDRKFEVSDKVSIVKEYGMDIYDSDWYGIVDANDNVIAPLGYSDIDVSHDKKAFICRYGKNPCDIYNDDGKMIAEKVTEAKFVEKNNENCFIIVQYDDKYGLLDSNGNVVLKCEYEDIKALENGFVTCRKDDKYALFNRNAKQVSDFGFDDCYLSKDNLIYGVINKKHGVVDEKMQVVIPFKYDYLEPFNEKGVTVAKKDNLYGCINLKNQPVTDFKYMRMYTSYDGYIRACNYDPKNEYATRKYGLLNKDGKVIADCIYDDIHLIDNYAKNYFPVEKNGKDGYIDLDGKTYFGEDQINIKYAIQFAEIKGYKEKYFNQESKRIERARKRELAIYRWKHRKDKPENESEENALGE